jgi:hypothetical protein
MSHQDQEHDFSAPLKGWASFSRTVNQGNYSSTRIEMGKEFYLSESTHAQAIDELKAIVNTQADAIAATNVKPTPQPQPRRGGGGGGRPYDPNKYQRIREYASTHDEAETQKVLESLQWKPFGPNKPGEWAFAKTREGDLLGALVPIQELIDALRETGGRIAVGEYEYLVKSEGKFVNRYHKGSGSR